MKKRFYYIAGIILTLVILFAGSNTQVIAANIQKNTIYDQYIDIIKNYKNYEDDVKLDKFALIDLDGDEIPELICTGSYDDEYSMFGMQPYLIVGNNENGAVVYDIMTDGVASAGGYRGTLYYLPGLGKLHEYAVSSAFYDPTDTIYTMKDGKIETFAHGEFKVDVNKLPDEMSEDDDIMNYGHWYWDGESVTKDEYKKRFVSAIENTHGIALSDIDYMSRDEIIKALKDKKSN